LKIELEELLAQALAGLPGGMLAAPVDRSWISVERTRDAQHGDYACNIALRLAKLAGRKPRELAEAIVAALPASPLLARAEVAGAGAYAHIQPCHLQAPELVGRARSADHFRAQRVRRLQRRDPYARGDAGY
jgi:arginyl-tRNA synthetase